MNKDLCKKASNLLRGKKLKRTNNKEEILQTISEQDKEYKKYLLVHK